MSGTDLSVVKLFFILYCYFLYKRNKYPNYVLLLRGLLVVGSCCVLFRQSDICIGGWDWRSWTLVSNCAFAGFFLWLVFLHLYTTDKLFISEEILSATTHNLGICFFCTENSNIRWRIFNPIKKIIIQKQTNGTQWSMPCKFEKRIEHLTSENCEHDKRNYTKSTNEYWSDIFLFFNLVLTPIFFNFSLITVTERSSIEQGTGSFSEYLSATSDISSEMLAFLAALCLKIIHKIGKYQ
jgi:hypothetical protein